MRTEKFQLQVYGVGGACLLILVQWIESRSGITEMSVQTKDDERDVRKGEEGTCIARMAPVVDYSCHTNR